MVDDLNTMKDLKEAHAAIDEADAQIAEALAKRFRAVTIVENLKHRSGLPAIDEQRRQTVIDKAVENARAAGGDPILAQKLYELMTDYCTAIQDEYLRTATGPLADYYEQGFSQEPDGTLSAVHYDGRNQRITSQFKKAAENERIQYQHTILDIDDETQEECVVRMECRSFENEMRMPRDVRTLYRQLSATFC